MGCRNQQQGVFLVAGAIDLELAETKLSVYFMKQ